MEIQHEHLVTRGEFFIRDDQKRKVATMMYTMKKENVMVIEHTIVDEQFEGQGIGRKLVEAGVLYAREKDFKIIPECPYAAAVFRKTPEYNDVLEGSWKV